MSAALASKTDATDSFFRAFKQDTRVDAGDYAVVAFGDSEAMADELLELVLLGIKRATASLARDYGEGGDRLPRAGDYAVVVDGRGKPRCVWRTTEVEVKPLVAADEAFAFDEGEGKRTLDSWLADHRAIFAREAERKGFVMTDDEPTVFERFTIVWPRLFADGDDPISLPKLN